MLNEVDPAANRSTANGSTTVFPYTFLIYTKTDIEVLVDLVVKTVDTDYTVDGLGVSGGGNVTFVSAPANASIVTRIRKQPGSQLSDYQATEAFPAERIENDLDKLAMQVQQVREQLHRALLLPKKSSLVDQGMDVPVVNSFARGKSGGGIDWAIPTNAGALSSPVAIVDGGTGATTAAGARTNLLVYTENTLVDAKGDLLIGASDNTLARLAPPATTGFVPTYDPSATNFISWGPRAQPNPIINGNMEIWQRGTTFPITAFHYTADRWRALIVTTTALFTVNRSTNVPSVAQAGVLFNYSLEVDVTTADAAVAAADLAYLTQAIEGYNWRHFAQRAVVLSFWVQSTKTGVHSVGLSNGINAYCMMEYTVNAVDTWEYKTVTFPASPSAGTWDYTSGAGVYVRFPLIAGSNSFATPGSWGVGNLFSTSSTVNDLDNVANFFRITGVKMELGSVATPIQFVPFEVELARAMRYYQKSFDYTTTPAQNAGTTGMLSWASPYTATTAWILSYKYAGSMRASPTLTFYNPQAANALSRNITDALDDSAPTLLGSRSQDHLDVSITQNAANTLGDWHGFHWTAEAEL